MNTDRERQLEYLGMEGGDTIVKIVAELLRKRGTDFLTDDQVAEITSTHVAAWRRRQKENRIYRRAQH